MSTTKKLLSLIINPPAGCSEAVRDDIEYISGEHLDNDAVNIMSKFNELKMRFPNAVPYTHGLWLTVFHGEVDIEGDGDEEITTLQLSVTDTKLFTDAMREFGYVQTPQVIECGNSSPIRNPISDDMEFD